LKFNGAESNQSRCTLYVQLVGTASKRSLNESGEYPCIKPTFAVTGTAPEVEVNILSVIPIRSLFHPNHLNSTLNVVGV